MTPSKKAPQGAARAARRRAAKVESVEDRAPPPGKPAPAKTPEQRLFEKVLQYRLDPLGFVEVIFPWGKENTSLAQSDGPRIWHRDLFGRLQNHLLDNEIRVEENLEALVFQLIVASGHGVGKSAWIAWFLLWFFSTRLGGIAKVIANNDAQLRKVTFAEISKWFTLAANSHWFHVEGLTVTYQAWFAKLLKEQRGIAPEETGIFGVLWSEDNTEAIQGTHNQVGVAWMVDEGITVPKKVFEAISPGSFTEKTKSRFLCVFSNYTRCDGEFDEIMQSGTPDWVRLTIDSSKVEGIDQTMNNRLIEKHGADSDEVRRRVTGKRPRASDDTFIPEIRVRNARGRRLDLDPGAPKIIGIDPAPRGGTTALAVRQGRVVTRVETESFIDNVKIVDWAQRIVDQEDPDAIFIDGGNGSGVIDEFKRRKYKVIEVLFGEVADKPHLFADRRTEMWEAVNDWLPTGAIPDDAELETQLKTPKRWKQGKADQVSKLESKRELKERGVSSPDRADSVALTFAKEVNRLDRKSSSRGRRGRGKHRYGRGHDYLPCRG